MWGGPVSGFCAVLAGIGLARFAYTPLLPALIAARWFTASDAGYLGAANLGGYLAGALAARPIAARVAPTAVLRGMMALVAVAFFACAVPLSFSWFFAWRFVAGLAGGALMVLAAPTVLPHVAPERRGVVGGVIFTGVGVGIALSGTLVPLLLRLELAATWCGLGALAVLLTAIAWRGWPATTPSARGATADARAVAPLRPALVAVYVAYGLNAAGLVPHMVFLVDFVARGLGQGLDAGARYWVLAGLGATVGPVVAGSVADRIGFARALRYAFVVQAIAVGLLAIAPATGTLVVSSVVAGAFIPGIVPLALGRIQHVLGGQGDVRAAWGFATTAFALFQAGGAWGFSFLFAQTGTYAWLFALGAAALVVAFVIDVAVARDKVVRHDGTRGVSRP